MMRRLGKKISNILKKRDIKELQNKMPELPKQEVSDTEMIKDNGRRSNLYINETEIRKLLKNKR